MKVGSVASGAHPWAADPGAASFGVCVCRSVWPLMKSFNPEKAQIDALGFTPLGLTLPAPGGPVTSPARAALAPATTTARTDGNCEQTGLAHHFSPFEGSAPSTTPTLATGVRVSR